MASKGIGGGDHRQGFVTCAIRNDNLTSRAEER